MKKKLLLIVSMVALLVCLLAVCVSAETVLKPQDNNAYGELSLFDESVTVGRTDTRYGFTPYIDAEGTTYARIVVGDGTTFYTFPTAYALSNTAIYGEGTRSVYYLDLTSLNSAMAAVNETNPGWTYKNVYRIEMPYNMTYLNGGNSQAFQEYTNIIEIFLQPKTSVKDQNKTMIFWKCNNLETIHNLDTFVFRKGCLGGSFQNCAKLTNITIGVSSEVTDTGENLFNGCTSLQSVNFKEAFPNLQIIGKNTFSNCQNLKNFSSNGQEGAYVIQSTVTAIYQDAFNSCKAMKYVSIPASVTSIGTTAFSTCTSLVFVDFNDNQNVFNVDNWGQFISCTSLLAVSLPDNYKYIPNRMFTGCSSLRAVYLPQNLERIDTNGWNDDPFNGCKYLYFVQEAFEVRDENGNFYTAETFVQPQKPDVYYMPNTLSQLCTNKTSGKCFTSNYNLNPVIVFGTNMVKITTEDGIFLECGSKGTLGSGVTAVFLGDMEQIRLNTNGNRPKGIKYVFANENDKSLADVNIINNTTSGYNLNDKTEGFYFCKGNCYYLLNGIVYNGTYSDSVLTKIEGAVHYAEPNRTVITQNADCEKVELSTTYCFCSAKIEENVQTADALGHDVSEIPVIVYANNNFFANGCAEYRCTRENCTHLVSNEVNAIFTALGYTKTEAENPSVALMQSFDIDTVALKAYEKYGANKIRYGVIAVRETEAVKAGSDVMNANGEYTAEKGGFAEFNDTNYADFNVKVTGIGTNKDAKLFACACILVRNEGGYESYYATMDGEALSLSTTLQGSICYNDITKTVSE